MIYVPKHFLNDVFNQYVDEDIVYLLISFCKNRQQILFENNTSHLFFL